MTRQDYILHLDTLRKGVLEIVAFDRKQRTENGWLSAPTELEQKRNEKTQKAFEDLAVRLYEDAAVSEKVKTEKLLAGDLEQAEITFPNIPEKEKAKPTKKKGGAK